MLSGRTVPGEPGGQPDEIETACHDEGGAPAEAQRDNGNDEWRDNGPDVRAAVEYPRREGAFLFWKPFSYGLDGGREVSRFTDAESKARGYELAPGTRQRMRHCCGAPDDDCQSVAKACAQTVDDAAGDRHHHRVCELKCGDDPAVVRFGPVEVFRENGFEDAENLTIDVIDGGGEEQKTTDDPADVTGFLQSASPVHCWKFVRKRRVTSRWMSAAVISRPSEARSS